MSIEYPRYRIQLVAISRVFCTRDTPQSASLRMCCIWHPTSAVKGYSAATVQNNRNSAMQALSKSLGCVAGKCTTSAVSSCVRLFSKERAGKSIRPGCAIILDNQPHRCIKFVQGKRGKGGGFVKATLKNIITGNSFEKTFTSDEMVEHADLERRQVNYSWCDDNNYIFMDAETYEEVIIPMTEVEQGQYLVPGLEVLLWTHA